MLPDIDGQDRHLRVLHIQTAHKEGEEGGQTSGSAAGPQLCAQALCSCLAAQRVVLVGQVHHAQVAPAVHQPGPAAAKTRCTCSVDSRNHCVPAAKVTHNSLVQPAGVGWLRGVGAVWGRHDLWQEDEQSGALSFCSSARTPLQPDKALPCWTSSHSRQGETHPPEKRVVPCTAAVVPDRRFQGAGNAQAPGPNLEGRQFKGIGTQPEPLSP